METFYDGDVTINEGGRSGRPFVPASSRPVQPTWGNTDHWIAAMEISKLNAGLPKPADLHPLSEQMLAKKGDWTTIELMRDYLASIGGEHVRAYDDRQILGMAISTNALGDLYGATANERILTRLPRLLGKVFTFCAPIELNNYLPTETGAFELSASIDEASPDMREWQTLLATATSEQVGLRSSPIRLRFTEQFTVNDEGNARNAVVDATILAAAQNESRAAFGVLSMNGTLKDGNGLFVTANTVIGASKSAAAVDSAVAKLRKLPLNDAPCDAEPFALLVPSEDEATARGIIAASSTATNWLRLVATSYLPAGAWYLVADPSLWPTVVRGTMRGAYGQSLKFGTGLANAAEGVRDVILEGLHTYEYKAVNRTGVVKIEVS